ncbi:Glycosyl transferase, family 2? [hydrothermal vent metagenome]|uniref:Glycosyl transferase, family 2 n=1 Tax=hydrothermal vent metagenome TaxID=652676 RepID=A0A3B1A4H0_9ZZZZ
MPNKLPLVSVVIPTHNRFALLCRAVNSVLAQSYESLECIVVDDGSTDGTCDLLSKIKDPRLVYLRHETPRYASAARNTGIERASGEYIAFLDDDDEWMPSKLEKQIACMQAAPEKVGMVYCWAKVCDGKGDVVRNYEPTIKGNVFSQVLDEQRIGNCSTLLVKKNIVEQVGGFDESLPRGNDGDFIRRVTLHYDVDFVPELLIKYVINHGYQRITRSDETGIRHGIFCQKDKLEKFKNELAAYPQQTAIIYAFIGHHYCQLKELGIAIRWYAKAIGKAPFCMRIYRLLFRGLKARVVK